MFSQRTVASLCQNLHLRQLKKTRSESKRRNLIESATTKELLCLVKIAYNLLHAHFPLKRRQLTRLKAHAPVVRKLARLRTPKSTRILIQSGAGVAAIVPLIAPILLHLLQFVARERS